MTLRELLDNTTTVQSGDEENALECLLSAVATHSIIQPSFACHGKEEQLIHEINSLLSQKDTNPTVQLLDKELVAALRRAARLILPALSPFQLHATVQQSVVWEDNNEPSTFTLICLVLCCHALMQSPQTIVKRRERWRSLLWETLLLFQRYSASKPCQIQGGRSVFLFLHLWLDCVLSAVARVRDALAEAVHQERRFQVAFVAATLATTSQLLIQMTRRVYHDPRTDPSMNDISDKLLDSIQRYVVISSETPLDSLLCFHPWRSKVSKVEVFSCEEPSFGALLAAYTAPNEDDNEEHVLAKVREEMCFVDCEWNSTGIALLVASYWNSKPVVWSWEYQWRLFFPHLSSLLHIHDKEGLDQDVTDKPSDGQVDYKEQVQQIGFDLLQSLVQTAKLASLEMPNTVYDRHLPPIGLFQLLSNRVVASSMSKNTASLPSAGQTYQIMKNLLSVYTPQTQYSLVKTLVQTCPHPGMKPKLLDLWRGFILWQDTPAVKMVLSHLETEYIQRLTTDYVDHSNPKQVIANAEELVSSAEMFVAALGLIQIWAKMNSSEKHAISRSLIQCLTRIKSSLQATFEHWTSGCAEQRLEPPTDSFRLYLLDDSVTQTIKLLT